MKTVSVTAEDYKMYIIIIISSMFFCGVLQEVIERIFGLNPLIKKASDIKSTTDINDSTEQMKKFVMNKRMTKQLDLYGHYRIVSRGSIQYVKGIVCIFFFVWCTILFGKNNGEFFMDHFIHLSPESANNKMYLTIAAWYIGFYAWETISDRYGKLHWSVLGHHVMSVFALTFVLLGYYNPFATWYGYIGVTLYFPIGFGRGLRDTKSNKYPNVTRFVFKFNFYFYIMVCIMNLSGQIYILANGIMTGKMDMYIIIIMIIVCLVWLYDDYCLMKALKIFSTLEYELVDELVGDVTGSTHSQTNIEIQSISPISTSIPSTPQL